MIPPSGESIREMTPKDIAAGLALCRASGWNQTERDWQFFLTAVAHGALVAEQNGHVIGTVATLPYGAFTWISMVLVDPVARGRGVGTALLHRALELVDPNATARLDATPSGETIYRTLGFVSEYRLARWYLDPRTEIRGPRTETRGPRTETRGPRTETRGPRTETRGPRTETRGSRTEIRGPRSEIRSLDVGVPGTANASAVRPLERADWAAVRELDLRAFGAVRINLLERLAEEAPEYARVLAVEGGMQGYLFGRHGRNREHLGPLVADREETAAMLLESCLAAHPERPFFIDVPDGRHAWTQVLSTIGFAIERPFIRMHRGALTAPGQPSSIYAIAGPEFG